MIKFNFSVLKRAVCCILCLSIIVSVPVILHTDRGKATAFESPAALTIWQIDSFEGGKGSRASYLQKIADKFSENNNCYFTVKSLSAESARLNLSEDNIPDLISYGAGIYGIEQYVKNYRNWCHGGYCILSTDSNADFSDINKENTVINSGTENYIDVCAMFCGLIGAEKQKATSAYVNLINGKFKYLLGSQRDIYRLKTREVQFKIKPVTEYNDLYQNISIVTNDVKKRKTAENYIGFLLQNSDKVSELGLMVSDRSLYEDEMSEMENLNYNYKISSPVSLKVKEEINESISINDENKLKILLKSL